MELEDWEKECNEGMHDNCKCCNSIVSTGRDEYGRKEYKKTIWKRAIDSDDLSKMNN